MDIIVMDIQHYCVSPPGLVDKLHPPNDRQLNLIKVLLYQTKQVPSLEKQVSWSNKLQKLEDVQVKEMLTGAD